MAWRYVILLAPLSHLLFVLSPRRDLSIEMEIFYAKMPFGEKSRYGSMSRALLAPLAELAPEHALHHPNFTLRTSSDIGSLFYLLIQVEKDCTSSHGNPNLFLKSCSIHPPRLQDDHATN